MLKVDDGGVLLTLRYLCKPKSRCSTTCFLWENTLDAFQQEEDLCIAYSTRRVITLGHPFHDLLVWAKFS